MDGDRFTVQFYDYSDKHSAPYAADQLALSTREAARPAEPIDAGVKPDCEVEWHGTWWSAKVLKRENGKLPDPLPRLRELLGRVDRREIAIARARGAAKRSVESHSAHGAAAHGWLAVTTV
jgi:hypothetical protein